MINVIYIFEVFGFFLINLYRIKNVYDKWFMIVWLCYEIFVFFMFILFIMSWLKWVDLFIEIGILI